MAVDGLKIEEELLILKMAGTEKEVKSDDRVIACRTLRESVKMIESGICEERIRSKAI